MSNVPSISFHLFSHSVYSIFISVTFFRSFAYLINAFLKCRATNQWPVKQSEWPPHHARRFDVSRHMHKRAKSSDCDAVRGRISKLGIIMGGIHDACANWTRQRGRWILFVFARGKYFFWQGSKNSLSPSPQLNLCICNLELNENNTIPFIPETGWIPKRTRSLCTVIIWKSPKRRRLRVMRQRSTCGKCNRRIKL